jgi:hypothetical protein
MPRHYGKMNKNKTKAKGSHRMSNGKLMKNGKHKSKSGKY